jgi:hypothetical protein
MCNPRQPDCNDCRAKASNCTTCCDDGTCSCDCKNAEDYYCSGACYYPSFGCTVCQKEGMNKCMSECLSDCNAICAKEAQN